MNLKLDAPKDTALSDLVPYPNNARIHNIKAIASSLKANGQFRPIVVQKSTSYILAGNGTAEAARSLGHKTIQAQFIDVDDETAKRIVLADNRTGDLASYDNELLAALLDSLDDMTGTGFEILNAETPIDSGVGGDDFPAIDITEETEYRCPKCQYEWNGKAR